MGSAKKCIIIIIIIIIIISNQCFLRVKKSVAEGRYSLSVSVAEGRRGWQRVEECGRGYSLSVSA